MRNSNTARNYYLNSHSENNEELDALEEAEVVPNGNFSSAPFSAGAYKVVGQRHLPVNSRIPPPLPGYPEPGISFNTETLHRRATSSGNDIRYRPLNSSQRARPKLNPASKLINPGSIFTLRHLLASIAILALTLLVYLFFSFGLKAWQTWQDDLTYGRPRTMQLDQFVGHNEQEGIPSHFIAQNNNQQITVVEYPGGNVTKTRVLQGPKLFGKDASLVPVKIHFEDVNGDGHVDLVLSIDNQLVIYINQDGEFRPITSLEKSKVKLRDGSGF